MAEPMFPILNDEIIKAIPWAAIEPHEAQARRNHSQTLKGLASRGGLDVTEAVLVMLGRPLFFDKINAAQMAGYRTILMRELQKFEQARLTGATNAEPPHG